MPFFSEMVAIEGSRQNTMRGSVASLGLPLRLLGASLLLHPLGRAVSEALFAVLRRPVPGLVALLIAGLYGAIPVAAAWLALRATDRRTRVLVALGAALSVLGLLAEMAPVRVESASGAVLSIVNDMSLNLGVIALAAGVATLSSKETSKRGLLLDGSIALSLGIVVEIIWARLRGAAFVSPADHATEAIVFAMSQVLFLVPLGLLSAASFITARPPRASDDGAHRALDRFALTTFLAVLPVVALALTGARIGALTRILIVLEGALTSALVLAALGADRPSHRALLLVSAVGHVVFIVVGAEVAATAWAAWTLATVIVQGELVAGIETRALVRSSMLATAIAVLFVPLGERMEVASTAKVVSSIGAVLALIAIVTILAAGRRERG